MGVSKPESFPLFFPALALTLTLSSYICFCLVKLIYCAMFDFCKLEVYQKAKAFCILVSKLLASGKFDKTTKDQLRRASFSIMLNIAEGSSRFSNKDRKNFMIIARGSAFESAAIMEYLFDTSEIQKDVFDDFTDKLEQISKMLFSLIQHLDEKG